MNRWNKKGSTHAHLRMAELRARKEHIALNEAAKEWCAKNGIAWDSKWWAKAQAAGCARTFTRQERIAFFRGMH